MKNIRSSLAAILCTELSKTQLFPVSIVKLRKCRFRISIRGQAILWNNLGGSTEKDIQSSSLFKTKTKNNLLNFENEVTFF